MSAGATTPTIPRPVLVLAAVYCAASLAHFAHNAEYISFYPNLPAWLTREKVYLSWLVVTSLGVAALLFARFSRAALALLFLGAYDALGLDGFAHYTLAPASQHTVVSNITIWSEAITGFALLLVSAILLARRFRRVHALHRAPVLPAVHAGDDGACRLAGSEHRSLRHLR